jgi:uncharacterized membrane protein (UPF0182 family)
LKRQLQRKTLRRPLWILIGLIAIVVGIHVWIDRLYDLRLHVALGYGAVYSTNMIFELLSRYGGALAYALLGLWAIRPFRNVIPSYAYEGIAWAGGVLGWVIGYGMWSLSPTEWLLFFHHTQFGKVDPIFHLDMAFYVYELPLLLGLVGRLLLSLILFLIVRILFVFTVFAQQQMVTGGTGLAEYFIRQSRVVLSLIGVLFVGFAGTTFLDRYQLMLSSGNGSFVYGPDFVTAKLNIPIFTWIHIAALLLTAWTFIWMAIKVNTVVTLRDGFAVPSWKQFRRPILAFSVYVVSVILTSIVGALVNSLYVHPNQNSVELPYIKNTIDATRWALGIENVHVKPFKPADVITQASVKRDQNALMNVRVNDQGQTTTIYDQLQSFKNYFDFTKAAVDRYKNEEVYVSTRQMDVGKLPVQTWVNKTLVYTHGYGIAVSPVNQFDSDGLPLMWAKDTPQKTQPPIPTVTQPRIYFGMMDNNVIAPSKQPEFDYPVGSSLHASHYQGGYGLPIQGNRLLLAIKQGTLKFYTSDQITSKSLWLFDRDIYQRVQAIAPFLNYDKDAFPFVDANGHILWMLDAYTESKNIPYAQSFLNTAYLRNSVKVVMNAYTGKVTFYVVNQKDPMLESLLKTYPSLFTTQIPADIRAHFRYPRDLFQAQAEALTRYHMTSASAFYNQDDLWALAKQIYQQNQTVPRPPVYQMIRMPDQQHPHFVLSELFTPANKDNLNGWMIADNEPGHYGQLSVYQFPQSNLIFGPMQAENQIDSNPAISSQLTLWNQQGSHVVRGDLLLVPVGDAILYVEPVYLVANRQNSLPQLERVIIDYNKQVYIDTSLGSAIDDLLKGVQTTQPQPTAPPTGGNQQAAPTGQAPSLVQLANSLFKKYTTDTAAGNFEAAGKDLKDLGDILQKLKGLDQKQGK